MSLDCVKDAPYMDLEVSRICACARFSDAVGRVMNNGLCQFWVNQMRNKDKYRKDMTVSEMMSLCGSVDVAV